MYAYSIKKLRVKEKKMIEWKVSGKLVSGESFSFVVKAFDTWHAMNKAKLMMPKGTVRALSAFKA